MNRVEAGGQLKEGVSDWPMGQAAVGKRFPDPGARKRL